MPKVIEVIYENGVLKPLEKIELKEGEKLKITLRKIDLGEFVMAKLPESKIEDLEKRFEDENIY